MPFEEIHVGNRITHSSHDLCIFRGLISYNKCGSRGGTNSLVNLSAPCAPPTIYGLASLNALKEGRRPPNLEQWPGEEPHIAGSATIARKSSTQSKGSGGPTVPRPKARGIGNAFAMQVQHQPPSSDSLVGAPIAHPLFASPQQAFFLNLQDLIDLEEAGERVAWPSGMSATIARQLIGDGNLPPSIVNTNTSTAASLPGIFPLSTSNQSSATPSSAPAGPSPSTALADATVPSGDPTAVAEDLPVSAAPSPVPAEPPPKHRVATFSDDLDAQFSEDD